MIFQMGLFAVYAGFMYNDFFSVGLSLFSSGFDELPPEAGVINYKPNYDVKNEGGPGPYPFGIDPAWHGATNELLFMNSLKMKMSVIIGVVQMCAGLGLRWANAFYEG